MHGYQYQHGDRPLAGYTIQRAVGRGGFGEVYYALSDSGRQVAIKAIQGYEQIELRGVSQCMNLKNPHLVTIFDIRQNDRGQSFVIMEHVSGPSLRELLTDAPSGLGVQKACFFLREIGKGLAFLHDCGIVHRDLKPGNIFYENGYVKVGDYGLSKAISPSRHDGQTITVGTVHYMAPEIGAGCYHRSVDIYALGILLYEMLTGRVPFSGASHGEILMKHMMAEPDLAGINEPMAGVIRKALAKDPSQRYGSVQEMIEAVFGSEEVRSSVSQFSPNSLTVVAGRAAAPVSPRPSPPPEADKKDARPKTQAADASAGEGGAPTIRAPDPVTVRQRYTLAGLAAVVLAFGTGFFGGGRGVQAAINVLFVLAMICGASGGLLVGRDRFKLQSETGAFRRLVLGAFACAGAMIASSVLLVGTGTYYGKSGLSVAASLFITDWYGQMSPSRKERLSLGNAFMTGLWAFICSVVLGGREWLVIGIAAGVSLVVQVASPLRRPLPWGAARSQPPASRPRAAHPPGISSRKRLWALLLAALPGLAGLHRFYVGKVGTGLIWLFTGGLLGIGQIVDIVLIILGGFRDAGGRRLVSWTGEAQPGTGPAAPAETAQPAPHTEPDETSPLPTGYSVVSTMLSALGGLLLLAAFVIGLAVAAHITEMTAAGVFGTGLARSLEGALGMADWPRLVRSLGTAAAAALTALAMGVLILARRRASPQHMVRAVLGAAVMMLAVFALHEALAGIPWGQVAEAANARGFGPAIDLVVRRAGERTAMLALASFVLSMILLAWPPRRALYGSPVARKGLEP